MVWRLGFSGLGFSGYGLSGFRAYVVQYSSKPYEHNMSRC